MKWLILVLCLVCMSCQAEEEAIEIDADYDLVVESDASTRLIFAEYDETPYRKIYFNMDYYKYIKSITQENGEWVIEWEVKGNDNE